MLIMKRILTFISWYSVFPTLYTLNVEGSLSLSLHVVYATIRGCSDFDDPQEELLHVG